MADGQFITSYQALDQHRMEMRAALRQRRWRLAAVLGVGLGCTAAAYWALPPLALLVAGCALLAGFFAGITGSSSVPADQLSGAEGEEKVLRELEKLPHAYTIFNQLRIPDASLPNGQRELDFLVAGPNGLHLIEVKNSSGLIYVRPHEAQWPLSHKAGCGGRPGWNAIANPLNQVRAQAAALESWLLRHGQLASIHPVVCFARSDVALQDRDASPIPMLTLPELIEHISRPTGDGTTAIEPGKLIGLLSGLLSGWSAAAPAARA